MIRAAVWLSLLGAVVYIAWHYAGPHYRAWRFRDAMGQTARLASAEDRPEMRANLLESAAGLGVPLTERRLGIRRDPRGRTRLDASWEEIVRIEAGPLGIWIDTLRFDQEVVAPQQ
ncbi:MAG: hypothetical protein R3199_00635 [Gemmatimonadota bacterium]|nr:hypothetical protein [Gemmatimonadota bacterium]